MFSYKTKYKINFLSILKQWHYNALDWFINIWTKLQFSRIALNMEIETFSEILENQHIKAS